MEVRAKPPTPFWNFQRSPANATIVAIIEGKILNKRTATTTFQKVTQMGSSDTRVTGHVCRVMGAHAMVIVGAALWLCQAVCR